MSGVDSNIKCWILSNRGKSPSEFHCNNLKIEGL